MNNRKSQTDWERVKAFREGDHIPYDPEDGPYDPNDDAATEAFFKEAILTRPGQRGPQKAPAKRLISLRLSQDVLDHYRSLGPGWQARIDEVLQKAIASKNIAPKTAAPRRRRKAS